MSIKLFQSSKNKRSIHKLKPVLQNAMIPIFIIFCNVLFKIIHQEFHFVELLRCRFNLLIKTLNFSQFCGKICMYITKLCNSLKHSNIYYPIALSAANIFFKSIKINAKTIKFIVYLKQCM